MGSHDSHVSGGFSPRIVPLALLVAILVPGSEVRAQGPVIGTHDNVRAAGSLNRDTLTLDLVAEQGMWYPGGPDGFGLPMYAFREAGGELQIPGPLVRVRENTEVVVNVRNAVQEGELHLRGFRDRDGSADEAVIIPEGETRTIRFTAGEPGAFLYWASVDGIPLRQRLGIDSQLSGAFVVDPVGYDQGSDRVLVLGRVPGPDSGRRPPTPRSTRSTAGAGRSRNASTFRWAEPTVGTSSTDLQPAIPCIFTGSTTESPVPGTAVAIAASLERSQREVVTEVVPQGETMTMEWEAANAGNWLFHCHIVAHVDPANMHSVRGPVARAYDHFTEQHMSGMTLGIHAHGMDKYDTDDQPGRFLRMELNGVENYFGDKPGIAIAFNETGVRENVPTAPGPPLFLERDELVSIEIVNNLDEPTSIHWHGMELQSYYDGVAGFGGTGTSITPEIEPGHSFEVRMQPPRSGTFIYHTHLNDRAQLSAGLYGAMIVSDSDEPFDTETDRIFVIGLLGESGPVGLRLEGPRMGINGSTNHRQEFAVGREYRLRIINIADNNAGFAVWLNSPAGYEQWTPVAQDGADLPKSFHVPTTAQRQQVSVGETFDFLWTPQRPGTYWLEVRRGGNGEFMGQAQLVVGPRS